MLYITVICVFMLASAMAFAPMSSSRVSGSSLRMDAVDKALNSLARNKILTKTAQLGLLSRLEKSGFRLSTVAPILKKADELEVLPLLAASSDKILPLAVTAIDLAPTLLPVAGGVLKAGPVPLAGAGVASLVAAVTIVFAIPDDSVSNIALQTALAVPLGAIIPGASLIGAGLLSKLK